MNFEELQKKFNPLQIISERKEYREKVEQERLEKEREERYKYQLERTKFYELLRSRFVTSNEVPILLVDDIIMQIGLDRYFFGDHFDDVKEELKNLFKTKFDAGSSWSSEYITVSLKDF